VNVFGVCKSCGAPILWARSDRGSLMPLDRSPHPDGNLELVQVDGVGQVARVVVPDPTLGHRRLSHFVTCPNAPEHRRRRHEASQAQLPGL
jgi:hypothetical protein